MVKRLIQHIVLFMIGGYIYLWLEIAFRGHTHWTMFFLGGACFIACGLLDELPEHPPPFWLQCVIGGGIITALEYLTGLVVNVLLGWQVWDYSGVPLNLHGQICLSYSLLWVVLAGVAVKLENFLHRKVDRL